jgi:hypothetical protein
MAFICSLQASVVRPTTQQQTERKAETKNVTLQTNRTDNIDGKE